jgi:hypothetical protein
MRNLHPQDLAGNATLITGRHKPPLHDGRSGCQFRWYLLCQLSRLSEQWIQASVSSIFKNTAVGYLHLTFSGLVCILSLWGRKEHCPFTARLRGLKLDITFLVADMAEMALWVRCGERVAPRTVRITGESTLDFYRSFVAVVTLTRALVDAR